MEGDIGETTHEVVNVAARLPLSPFLLHQGGHDDLIEEKRRARDQPDQAQPGERVDDQRATLGFMVVKVII